MFLNLKIFLYKKSLNLIRQLTPKFIKKILIIINMEDKKNFNSKPVLKNLKEYIFPFYFLKSDLKQLPSLNYINNNHYEIQKELISKFAKNQKQNSFMTCPYLHELLLMRYKPSESFNFLDIGGEYVDFFLQLKKNFKNAKYYLFNINKINDNFKKIKKEYLFNDLFVIEDFNSACNNKYDFINLGSSIQYFDNYENILKNITKISNNIFFSGTILFESNKKDYEKHIIVEQVNCFPDINICYFFNKKYFYDFFYNEQFSLLFSKKNSTDKLNFKNFKDLKKIEYKDFFFIKQLPKISF